ncbi:MAG: hypothetical protein B6U72_01750 [Candidatus Altiarchaeales archaeon ex4484_2]|nr:MAG: hypothetical protein B6U72_01750 [Candidatus Altiarchaeales archaeon ex4484_2]
MDYGKRGMVLLALFALLLSASVSALELGESSPGNEGLAGVEQSTCRLLPGTPEYGKYIRECRIDSPCVRFIENAELMQRGTCDALKATVEEVCSVTGERAMIVVQKGLDVGYTELTESPLVEGRGCRFDTDTPGVIDNDNLSDIAATHFDFTMNNGHHIYASVKGEREGLDIENCSTTADTWIEGVMTSSHTTDEVGFWAQSIVASTAGMHHPGLLHSFLGKLDKWGNKYPVVKAFRGEFKKISGRVLVGYLGIKIGVLDKMEDICNDIDYFILLKPNLTQPVVVHTLDFFIHLLEPFYILGIAVTVFYLLFMSASPLGRARAKSTLLRMILSIGLIILTIPIMQLLLDLTHILSAYTMTLVDIAFFQIIFYLFAATILVLRYFMVILWAILFPFTIFLNSLHLTRRLGNEMLYQTGWWIATQFIEALIIVGITLAVVHMPTELVGEQAFRVGMGLACYLLIIIGPLFAMGLMDWLAMMIVAFSALEVPWLSGVADMAEEAEFEEYKKEKITPPKPVGPPKGPVW